MRGRLRLPALAAAAALALPRAAASSPPALSPIGCGRPGAAPVHHLAVRGAAMSTLADIFALNRELAAHGQPSLPHTLLTYGADLVTQRDRLVLAGASDVVVPRSITNDTYAAATGGTLDEAIAGLAVVCTPSWAVYPLAGIGTTRLDLATARRDAGTVDSALAGRAAGAALSARTLFDDYGVGIDYRGHGGGAARLSAGLRLGYVERFGRARWRLSGQPVAGGPKFGLSGPYLRAAVGLGF